jgi:hypothetical protein
MRTKLILLGAAALLAACGGGGGNTATTTTGAAMSDSAKAVAAADSIKKVAAKKGAPAGRHADIDTAAIAGQHPMLRETYSYEGSARDPFKSVLVAASRGPELPDLKLVAVIFDPRSPSNSLVTFREIGSDRRYTWHQGERFGRITVGEITTTDVTLMQDDFGVVHRQTYTLRKTEDGNP